MTIHARFLPKYPKRINVTGGLTKTEANGVVTLGFDYAATEFGAELDQAVATTTADAASTAADRVAAAASAAEAQAAVPVTITTADATKQMVVNQAGTAFQLMKRTVLLPDDFGWVASDTLANRHAALVAWAASATPGQLDRNTDYYIDTSIGPLTVAAGKIIDGNNAYILDTTTNGKLLELDKGALDTDTGLYAGNWQIGNLRLKGSGAVGLVTGGYGIHIAGVYNKATNAFPNYVLGGLLDNISMEDIGFTGVWSEFVRDARRNNIKVDGVGYAGFMQVSEIGNRTFQSIAQNIGPGTEPAGIPDGLASTSYGFAFTRKNDDPDLVTSPRSADCVLDNWRVVNNPNYTAVDCHSGDSIKFLNGYAFGVFKGINIGYEVESADAHGSLRCVAKNNTLFGLSTASKDTAPGVLVVGLATATDGLTKACIVEGNYVEAFGELGASDTGGIWLRGTDNAKVIGNTTNICRTNGIVAASDNSNLLISENTNRNAHGTSYSAGIGVTGANNTVTFGPNIAVKDAIYGTSTMAYGYYVASASATNNVAFLGGDQFKTVGTRYSIESGVVVRQAPQRKSYDVSVTINSGGSVGNATLTFTDPYSVTPRIIVGGASNDAFLDTLPLITGYSSPSTTGAVITARTPDNTSVGSTGGSVTVPVTVEGW